MACLLVSFVSVNEALYVILSDISSDIPFEEPVGYATIVLLEAMIQCNGGVMAKLINISPRINPGDFPGPLPIKVPASRAHAFPGCHAGLVLLSLHRQWPRVPGPTIVALQPGWI